MCDLVAGLAGTRLRLARVVIAHFSGTSCVVCVVVVCQYRQLHDQPACTVDVTKPAPVRMQTVTTKQTKTSSCVARVAVIQSLGTVQRRGVSP